MEKFLECMMLLCFIAATCNLIYRLVKKKVQYPAMERIAAVTTGIGFVLGVVTHIAAVPQGFSVETGLCILGAMLSYTAVLFTIPEKKAGDCNE